MAPIHQFKITHGTLDTDLVISTGRVQVVLIQVSNRSLTQTAVVSVEDKDGNVYLEIAVPPSDSRSVPFAEPTDFVNGLTIDDAPSNGNLIHVSVSHTRTL